jgi:nucleotide-binding universal stress UspA family protein
VFRNIIVVTNLEPNGDRALPIAAALGSLARVDVEVLKVASRSVSTAVDSIELSERAAERGWPAHAARVVQADDVPGAIAAEVNARPDALLVMATSARHAVVGHLLGSVSEAVLERVDRPVLLVGPHVPAELRWTRPTLVACVHPNVTADELVAAVADWTHTFPASPPRVVEVVPEAGFGACAAVGDTSHLDRVVEMLAAEGVVAHWRLVNGGIPEIRLEEVADRMLQPLFVVASTRWTGSDHGRSTTRRLAHRSAYPVLVVPARSAGSPTPDRPQGPVGPLHVTAS